MKMGREMELALLKVTDKSCFFSMLQSDARPCGNRPMNLHTEGK